MSTKAVEYLDVLDEKGNKTGRTKPRPDVHRDGDWHRSVHIFIINRHGDILLQRRAHLKETHPDMLDISVGGHLQAGDEPLEGAMREVKEEIGLDMPPTDFKQFLEHHSSTRPRPDYLDNCFFNSYLVRTDKTITDMTMQVEEVAELKFVPFNEFKKMVASNDPDLVSHPADYQALIEVMEPEFGKTNGMASNVLYAGFGGKGNSSGIVLEKLNYPEEHKILLKNGFVAAPRQVQKKIIGNEYDVVVLLGSTPKIKGSTFCLETTAKGETPYMTNLQYEKLAKELKQLGHNVVISNDAGRYLCNNVYYHTLKIASEYHLKCKAIFVHIPQSKCISSHEQMANSLVKAVNKLNNKEEK